MSGVACVLINEGTSASPLTSQITPAWLARCAQAVATQLLRDAAPIWGRAVTAVRAGADAKDVQPGEMVFSLQDSLPDAPGAIAYHDVNGAEVPVAFLGLQTCSTLGDVSSAISHELLEADGDEACNRWVDDGQGGEWALELADGVESNAYPVDLGDGQPPIMVSDFLLPSFFSAGSPGPYNFMAIAENPVVPTSSAASAAAPAGPFKTAAGGYQIFRQSGTGETQVTGKMRPGRVAKAAHWSSRVSRRGAHIGPGRGPSAMRDSRSTLDRAMGSLDEAYDHIRQALDRTDDPKVRSILEHAHELLDHG